MGNDKQLASPRRRAEGVTAVRLSGYKSIRDEQTIRIAPLTVLAGANGSGKSSVMQPLLLLKQTLDATYDPGPLLIDGPNVRFTSVDQFLPRVPGKHDSGPFKIAVQIDGRQMVGLDIPEG